MPENPFIPRDRPIGRLERLAYERALRDRERLPQLGYRFDEDAADHVCQFYEGFLRHHKGEWAGRPFELQPWQRFSLRELFGWKRPDGTRRFRQAYEEVPRKQGKTEKAAGGGLYLTSADREAGAEIYSAATKKDQAKICHGAALEMLKRSPKLQEHVGHLRNNIHCSALGSRFEPLGADADTMDGLNPHAAIIDELHAHKNRKVYDVLLTGMGARRQPLVWMITTAGLYDPTSIGWKMHQYATQVLEGVIEDDTFFAFITAADEDDAWDDRDTWRKANPGLGINVKWEYLEERAAQAAREPSFLNTFLRYHLNIWTQQVTRWISMDSWRDCPERAPEAELVGRPAYAALDLSQKLDLTALVLALPDDGGFWDLVSRFWCPEDRILERSNRDQVPYDAWARDGWIVATPGNVIDYDFIEAEAADLCDRFQVLQLAYDPWSAMQTAIHLQEAGLPVVEMRQGYRSMSEPSKEFEKLVEGGKLRHGDNPVLTWMANNVAVTEDPAGNIKPAKDKSTERIDGIVAAIMAIGRGTLGDDPEPQTLTREPIRVL
jgi:phage terminase large subunit-like protein